MFKDIAKEIANNEMYGVISLVIFSVVFAAVIVYVILMRKEKVEKLKNLPFEGEEKTSQTYDTQKETNPEKHK